MPRSLLIDRTCISCKVAQSDSYQVCDSCLMQIPLRPHDARREGLPLAYFASDYGPEVAELLHHFKLGRAHSVAKWMARTLHPFLPDLTLRTLLIPVPSGPKATSHRGFVPAAVFAQDLAALIPKARVLEAIWQRRLVKDQASLSVDLRHSNLEGSMLASPRLKRFSDYELVLVDDVVTTGASMAECQRALNEMGCEPKYLFAFAETLKKSAT